MHENSKSEKARQGDTEAGETSPALPRSDGRTFDDAEVLRVTLSSIGDGVIAMGPHGRVNRGEA